MKTTIFMPKQINVGFVNRSGTYTGKLAYIIYFDEKGVLRKEKSWNSWRDKKIDNVITDNVPTSGFVLNKKVGGYDTGWNHRQTYCRVYDPRGFEFEITIPNLLYILENATSTKGKGLEGEFVYGWDGKDLVLIPCDSPDYIELKEYNEILHEKRYVKAKDLVLGGTYKTKDNTEWIYMGRYNLYGEKREQVINEKYEEELKKAWGYRSFVQQYKTVWRTVNKGKHHYFVRRGTDYTNKPKVFHMTVKSLGQKFIDTVSTECVHDYAELFEMLECRTDYSPYDKTKDEYNFYTLEEFTNEIINEEIFKARSWDTEITFLVEDGEGHKNMKVRFDVENKTYLYYIQGKYNSEKRDYEKTIIGDIHQLFEQFKPKYKAEYLTNGKLYRRLNYEYK